ncbi:MAG: HEAT repeat domain-containing protein [Gloeobacteraceae cyanobacterium ES-bin-144]|nr:HEAT repeat domain-containing protein [Verrucomicrobiales bacterium]
MKLILTLLSVSILAGPVRALDASAVLAVASKFANPSADVQYQARVELEKTINEATAPGKSDAAAVTKTLILVMQDKSLPSEAGKYILRTMSRVATADAVDYLTGLLNGQDSLYKEEARQALQSIRDPKSVAALASALQKETNPAEKAGLMNSLAVQKSSAAVPLIAPYLVGSDPLLAQAAIRALAKIGGEPAVDALKNALTHSQSKPALIADLEKALLIASAGNPQVVLEIFQSTKSDAVKLAAFIALTNQTSDGSLMAMIEQALKSENSEIRHLALVRGIEMNLSSLQGGLAQAMVQMPEDDRMIVLANIHHLKPLELAEKIALSRMTASENKERIAAILALGKIGTKAAFDVVLQAVGERIPAINQAAGTAIASMNYPAAEETLLTMLKGTDSANKILAVKAVVFRQVTNTNALLIEMIVGPDEAVSNEAMKSLYFTASIEDLRVLCAKATAAQDAKQRKSLADICTKIATRINTNEAKELVKPLKPE